MSWGERVADYLLREADKPHVDPMANAMALLKRYRADVLASAPALRDAVVRAADLRERAERAEAECARLRAMLAADQPSTDPIVERMVALLRQRSRIGVAKYGTTLNRLDLDLADWLTLAMEETADATLYLLRARDVARQDGLGERGA